jgi:hypothetical protein
VGKSSAVIIESLTFCLILVLVFTTFTQVALSQPNSAPVIDSVSPISTDQLQTIVIVGSGFGNTPPQTSSHGDGSVNTIDGGDTPSMQIRNDAKEGGWTAGFQDSTDRNGIGIFLESWSDTEIVLGGFGGAFSTSGQGMWNLESGDQIRILVKVSGNVASFNTVVEGSQPDTSNGVAPVISSVSPISTDRLQTIVIEGSGFGDVQPQLMDLGDGSVNTVGGGDTPIIRIYNDGWKGWMAGVRDSLKTGWCLIGIILESWTDTEIVLGGFGTALTSYDQYSLNVGDPMRVVVVTSGGRTEYRTNAIAGSDTLQGLDSISALPTPILSVSCQSSTTFSDFRAEISGSLTYNGTGLAGVPVLLSYSVNGGNSWTALTLVNTDDNGDFTAVWLLVVTGNYLLKAEWGGNSSYAETSTEISFSVTSSPEQNVISVASTSTISAFAFNSTSRQLTFNVTGPSGTTGHTYVYVPKSLITDIFDLQVFLDGNPLDYNAESTGNSWLVTFTYHHSAHEVAMILNDTLSTPTIPTNVNQLAQWVTYIVIIALSLTVVILLVSRKKKNTLNSSSTLAVTKR